MARSFTVRLARAEVYSGRSVYIYIYAVEKFRARSLHFPRWIQREDNKSRARGGQEGIMKRLRFAEPAGKNDWCGGEVVVLWVEWTNCSL